MALAHLLVQGFESGLEHGDSVSEGLLSLLEVVLDKDSSDYFPAFPGSGQGIEVGEYEVVFSSFFFEFNISFEYF